MIHSSAGLRRLGVLMAFLMLFIGVALFTPLHKHQYGQSNRCSFDDLEKAFIQAAENCIEFDPGTPPQWYTPASIAPESRDAATQQEASRAPPALSI